MCATDPRTARTCSLLTLVRSSKWDFKAEHQMKMKLSKPTISPEVLVVYYRQSCHKDKPGPFAQYDLVFNGQHRNRKYFGMNLSRLRTHTNVFNVLHAWLRFCNIHIMQYQILQFGRQGHLTKGAVVLRTSFSYRRIKPGLVEPGWKCLFPLYLLVRHIVFSWTRVPDNFSWHTFVSPSVHPAPCQRHSQLPEDTHAAHSRTLPRDPESPFSLHPQGLMRLNEVW